MFDANNIGIPFPNITLSYLSSDKGENDVTKKEKTSAQKFVQEQKEQSKGLEEQSN